MSCGWTPPGGALPSCRERLDLLGIIAERIACEIGKLMVATGFLVRMLEVEDDRGAADLALLASRLDGARGVAAEWMATLRP